MKYHLKIVAGSEREKLYVEYLIIFLLYAGVTYGVFALLGFSTISHWDTYTQHYPMLVEFRQWLHALIQNPLHPQLWGFNYGLGADKFQMFTYYEIGDPLNYLSVLIPFKYLPTFFQLMVFLRLFLVGLSFILWISHYSVSNTSILIGTFIVLTSAFITYSVFEEPFFLNGLIVLPILIMSVNSVFISGNIRFFGIMVFLTLVSNFYLAYINLLGMIIYAVLAYVFHYRKVRFGRLFFKFVLGGITGALMAGIVVVPVVLALMNSPRMGQKFANGLFFYPLHQYLTLPMDFMGSGQMDPFSVALPAIPLAVISLIWCLTHFNQHQFKVINWLYIISLISLLIPAAAAIFNGLSSPSNKWMLLLIPLFGLSTTLMVDDASKKENVWLNRLIGRGLVVFLIATMIPIILLGEGSNLLLNYVYLSVYILILSQYKGKNNSSVNKLMLALVFSNAAVGLWQSQILIGKQAQNRLPNSAEAINSLIDNPFNGAHLGHDEQSRLSMTAGYATADVLTRKNFFDPSQKMVSFFSSMQQKEVLNFAKDMGDTITVPNVQDFYTDQKSRLQNYLGVKHVLGNGNPDDKVAPGYVYSGTSTAGTDRRTLIYTTHENLPVAYFQTNVVRSAQYRQLSATDKEAMLSSQASLADTRGLTVKKPVKVTQNIDFQLLDAGGKKVNPKKFMVKNSQKYRISFNRRKIKFSDYELRLELSNIKHTSLTLEQKMNQIQPSNPKYAKNYVGFTTTNALFDKVSLLQNIVKNDWQQSGWEITASAGGDHTSSLLQPGTDNLSYYQTITGGALNLGYFSNQPAPVHIMFGKNFGTWQMKMRLVAIPVRSKEYLKTVKQDQRNRAQKYHESGNTAVMFVHNRLPGVLQTTIPYGRGWKVSIDGHTSPVDKVNDAFLGAKVLKPGYHRIIFSYRTPGLILGLILSLIGSLAYGFILIYEHHRDQIDRT